MFGIFRKKKRYKPAISYPQPVRLNEEGEPIWGIYKFNENGEIIDTEEFPTKESADRVFQELMKPSKYR